LKGKLDEDLLKRFQSYTLTRSELRDNLYPAEGLTLFKDYASADSSYSEEEKTLIENKILCIDCEMVVTSEGF